MWEEPAQVFTAPVGTELPTGATTSLPEGWLPVGKDTDLSRLQSIFGGQLLHPTTSAPATAPSSEHSDTGRPQDDGTTPPTVHGAPRLLAKDWQAELIERWRAKQP